jgi:protein-tyrosine-phosphatase
LLFVCTGNTCRSPMAEGIMKELVMDEYGRSGVSLPIRVISAGTHAYNGSPASEYSVKAAALHGIDISNHRSQQITEELVEESGLILTMEKTHADFIKMIWPEIREVYNLKSYLKNKGAFENEPGIADPVSMGFDSYMKAFNEIKYELDRVTPYINSLVQEKIRKNV